MGCVAPCPGVEMLDQRAFTEGGDQWDDLLTRSYDNRIFLTSLWQRTWWQHFGSGDARILAIRDESGLQALLPLQVRTTDDRRTLTLAGDESVTDYLDALADKPRAPELLRTLWQCALTEMEFDSIDLRHVPSTSPLLPALQSAASGAGREVVTEQDEVCPVALLCSSWDGYLQMLSKKQRHEIRRKLRRAQEGVEWSWRTTSAEDDLDRDLAVFFRLHEASAREKARFMSTEMRTYFSALSHDLLRAGMLRLSIFSREGIDIASTLSFVYRDRYLLYNSGYDPEHAAHSPGIAAVALAMQDAIEEKAVAFDFLSGDEAYKYQFGASNTYTCRAHSA